MVRSGDLFECEEQEEPVAEAPQDENVDIAIEKDPPAMEALVGQSPHSFGERKYGRCSASGSLPSPEAQDNKVE